MKRIAFSLAGASLALILTSCGEDVGSGVPGACSLDFTRPVDADFGDPRIDALLEATAEFNVNATNLENDVRTACNAIASDLGAATSDDTAMACANAKDAIEGVFDAHATVTVNVAYTPAVCTVSATATADCVARCDASFDVEATPVTCEGGELSGGCSGECSGQCTVEGSASCTGSCSGSCTGSCSGTVEATCEGTCMGTCDGTCSAMAGDGSCMGACDGTCRGTCSGSIEGSCSAECTGSCSGSCRAEVTGSCEGQCTGSCDVMFTEPRCEGGEVNVEADADCSASCEAEASVNAECTEPEVVVTFEGDLTGADDLGTLAATLRDNLPTLLAAAEKSAIMVEAGVEMNTRIRAAADAFTDAGLQAQACLVSAGSVFVDATNSVSVSASVSVEVSATATASAGG